MEIIILDGRKMMSFDDMHDYLRKTMRLPAYYGRNLDALADCLSEFGSNITVIINSADDMLKGLGVYGEKLLRVFKELSADPDAFNFIINK